MPCRSPDQSSPVSAADGFWRSIDEFEHSSQMRDWMQREFPAGASELTDGVARRDFLKLMGASLALAGITGCGRRREESIVPYVRPPEDSIPGRPQFYATAMPFAGSAIGVLAESHNGRPTKIEGNPDHPASLGSTDAFAQASILSLYDPNRSDFIARGGQISTWSAFTAELTARMNQKRATGGAGLRILMEPTSSPTLIEQLATLRNEFPQLRIHQFDPVGRDNVLAGTRLAFGQTLNVIYQFDKATRILALDADFSCFGPAGVRYARDLASRRKLRVQGDKPSLTPDSMSRIYAIESTPTTLGTMADHRFARAARDIEPIARSIHRAILRLQNASPAAANQQAPIEPWIERLAADLLKAKGSSVVIVGDQQPPAVHAIAHAINSALGALGNTVVLTDPINTDVGGGVESLRQLASDIRGGQLDTLLILSANPAFTAPADLDFAGVLHSFSNATPTPGLSIHLSPYYDETSFRCRWHIPESHYLETWGDVRAFDGTASIIQPLINPLHQSRTAYELLGILLGRPDITPLELVRAHWQRQRPSPDFENLWRAALQRGVIEGTALPPRTVPLSDAAKSAAPDAPAGPAPGLEILFRPDPTIWDGRFAFNAWLQELPKPITKLTWDNVALISPKLARERNLKNEQVITLRYRGRELKAPVFILPGQADNSITLHLGYGRQTPNIAAFRTGFNAYSLRFADAPWSDSGLEIIPTSERQPLANTQPHQMMEGRDIVRVATLGQVAQSASAPREHVHHLSLYPEYDYNQPGQRKWGMAIDMSACMGCSACVVACQAENNIPTVGKTEVLRGREMHWLRIDAYYRNTPEAPDGPFFQPMLCQHCENAPCEVVCPVQATSHSAEGINEMTYNRCVGTRYCSNNCPYKVRRFNFLRYTEDRSPLLQLMRNPNVTLRERGVMEKCTFCVQRLNETRIEIKKVEVAITDNPTDQARDDAKSQIDALMQNLQTACQQACPTQAIIFGDLNYLNAKGQNTLVKQLHEQPQAYGVLTELNTEPRIAYLPRIKNPNPELV